MININSYNSKINNTEEKKMDKKANSNFTNTRDKKIKMGDKFGDFTVIDCKRDTSQHMIWICSSLRKVFYIYLVFPDL